jgi:hypothetical protein
MKMKFTFEKAQLIRKLKTFHNPSSTDILINNFHNNKKRLELSREFSTGWTINHCKFQVPDNEIAN